MPIVVGANPYSDVEKSILLQRGVGYRLLRIKYPLAHQLIDIPNEKKGLSISWKMQEKWLDDLLHEPLSKPRLILITSDHGELMPRGLALEIVRSMLALHLEQARNGETSYLAPRWHTLYGGRFDSLRDGQERSLDEGRPCALILDNIQIDMQPDKGDRMRDLLRIYEDQPRIVIAIGCNPHEFVQRRRISEPDMCFYLRALTTTYENE